MHKERTKPRHNNTVMAKQEIFNMRAEINHNAKVQIFKPSGNRKKPFDELLTLKIYKTTSLDKI